MTSISRWFKNGKAYFEVKLATFLVFQVPQVKFVYCRARTGFL